MKILLYKPDAKHGSFRVFTKNCDVEIVDDAVYIMENDRVAEEFKLVSKELAWSDDTKVIKEVVVKLVVKEIEREEVIPA